MCAWGRMGAEISACCEPTPQSAFINKPGGMQPQVYRGREGGYNNVTREGKAYPSNYEPSETAYHTQSPFMSGRSVPERREPVSNWGGKGVPVSFDAHRSPPRAGGTFDANGAYESQRRDTANYSSQVCGALAQRNLALSTRV